MNTIFNNEKRTSIGALLALTLLVSGVWWVGFYSASDVYGEEVGFYEVYTR